MGTSRAHLNPAVITDRQGRVTTVYRRPEQQGAARRPLPPQPVLASTPNPPADAEQETFEDRVLRSVLAELEARGGAPEPEPRDEAMRDELEKLMIAANRGRKLSKDKRVALDLFTNAQTRAVIDAWACDGFGEFFTATVTEKRFTYRQMATMAMLYSAGALDYIKVGSKQAAHKQARDSGELYHQLRTRREILGLDEDDIRNLAHASPEDQRTACAFGALFSAVREVNQYREPDKGLVTLAFVEAEDPLTVVGLIRSTGTTDVPTLRGLVAGAPGAVADGYL